MNTPIDDSSPVDRGAGIADGSRSKAPPSGGQNLPSLKAVVAELVAKKNVTHRLGAAGEVEVKGTLKSNRRNWKLRVSVFKDGEQQEDAEGAYPLELNFDRAPGGGQDDNLSAGEKTSGEIDGIARISADKYLAACASAQKLLAQRKPRRKWWLVVALLLALAGGSWAAWQLFVPRDPPAPEVPAQVEPAPEEPAPVPSPTPTRRPTVLEILECIRGICS